jgi:hypothetical protein
VEDVGNDKLNFSCFAEANEINNRNEENEEKLESEGTKMRHGSEKLHFPYIQSPWSAVPSAKLSEAGLPTRQPGLRRKRVEVSWNDQSRSVAKTTAMSGR